MDEHKMKQILMLMESSERPINIEEACGIRTLLFGTTDRIFGEEWSKQGFRFSKPVPYGLVQDRGGPCGLLAAVQATLLRKLMHGHNGIVLEEDHSKLEREEVKDALIYALGSILWRAGSNQQAIVALDAGTVTLEDIPEDLFPHDGIMERLKLKCLTSKDTLLHYLNEHYQEITSKDGGLCRFLCSLLLSRGLDSVKGDMDEIAGSLAPHLIGDDEFCSQEVVNLALTGRAVTNVFDGEREEDMGGSSLTMLKGINSRADVGFLSELEEVGSHYMHPVYPVWLLHGNNHYSVLFGSSLDILDKPEEPCKLFFYDCLKAGREKCLKVWPAKVPSPSQKSEEDASASDSNEDSRCSSDSSIDSSATSIDSSARPISKPTGFQSSVVNRCILTRWPGAVVQVIRHTDNRNSSELEKAWENKVLTMRTRLAEKRKAISETDDDPAVHLLRLPEAVIQSFINPKRVKTEKHLKDVCGVLDLDGFQLQNMFLVRELAFIGTKWTEPISYRYDLTPYSESIQWSRLPKRFLPAAGENVHAHDQVDKHLEDMWKEARSQECAVIAYKGGVVEYHRLLNLGIPSLDLEQLGCPKYDELYSSRYEAYHCPQDRNIQPKEAQKDRRKTAKLPKNPRHCARAEVVAFVEWLRKKLQFL